jgi:hypothetical protein
MFRVPVATCMVVITGVIALVSVFILYGNYNRSQLELLVVQSTNRMVGLIQQFRTDEDLHGLWQQINSNTPLSKPITPNQEIAILELLKTAEAANVSVNIDTKRTDETNMWHRSLAQWLRNPAVKDVWTRYMYLFQDRTNRLFNSVLTP